MASDPERRKPTLKNIAERAGVHPSTASRALNELPDSRIPARTIARVQAAAAELGYEVNPWARSLRTQRTMMLGLAIPRLTDIVLAHMFEAAQERAREQGYQTITVTSFDVEDSERSAIRGLIERRVDGLVLATATLDDPVLPEIEQRGLPFALLNRSSRDYPVVRGDDELGGYLATKHLLDRGHRRIAHISGPQFSSTAKLRLLGYRRALKEHRVRYSPRLVRYGTFDARSALTAAEDLLSLSPPPTAIFAINDIGAIAAMSAAMRQGLRVPEDVAIVGYNDSEVSSLLPIPLTTVRVPLDYMGRQAVDMVIRQIEGGHAESVVVRPQLVERQSTEHRQAGPDGAAQPIKSTSQV